MRWLLLLFFCFSAWSQQPSNEEVETYLEAVKDREVEDQLRGSPQFETCQNNAKALVASDPSKTQAEHFENCLRTEFANIDDQEIENLSQDLDLKSFNREASKNAKTVREYLSRRLRRAMYGVDDQENIKFKDRNIINHDVYYQLYAEQIGKNTLLEVSKYCLENLGLKGDSSADLPKFDPANPDTMPAGIEDGQFTLIVRKPNNNAPQQIEFWDLITDTYQASGDAKDAYKVYEDSLDPSSSANFSSNPSGKFRSFGASATASKPFSVDTTIASPVENFWKMKAKNMMEYEVCKFDTWQECNKHFARDNNEIRPYRKVSLISKLKNAQYKLSKELSSTGSIKDITKQTYLFCAGSAIQNMCELYKCRNVYGSDPALADQNQKCKENYFTDPTRADFSQFKTPKETGAIACNLMRRLSEYRNILKATNVLKADNQILAQHDSQYGFNKDGLVKGVYTGRGANNADRLTSISSKELVENVESIANAQDAAEELKRCFNDPENLDKGLKSDAQEDGNCQELLNRLTKESFGNIDMNESANLALQTEELNKINNQDDLIAFLQKYDMNDYLERDESGNLVGKFADLADPSKLEELKAKIGAEFSAKKKSLISNLKDRFYKETQITDSAASPGSAPVPDPEQLKNEVAKESIADMKQHKERVQSLFEYSNLVSSYLTIEQDGKELGDNSTSREIELANQDDATINDYFSDGGDSGSSSGGGGIDYLSAIDQIIGVKEFTDPNLEKKDD